MKRSEGFFLRALFGLTFFAVLVLLVSSCVKEKKQAVKGGEAPDFALNDLNGSEVRLSKLRGKVVLIEFWATWCPPCRDSIPVLNELYKRYNEKGLVLLGISVDKGQDVKGNLEAFVKEHTILYPVLIDNRNVSNIYGVFSIPTTFLIDKYGRIVQKIIGLSPDAEDTLSKEIERLL